MIVYIRLNILFVKIKKKLLFFFRNIKFEISICYASRNIVYYIVVHARLIHHYFYIVRVSSFNAFYSHKKSGLTCEFVSLN